MIISFYAPARFAPSAAMMPRFHQHAKPTMADIQSCVAHHFGIPALEMKSARRSRSIARPRQIAMYLARELTMRSLPDIGRHFGNRDHTTVIHAIKQIERLRLIDADLDADVQTLSRGLTA